MIFHLPIPCGDESRKARRDECRPHTGKFHITISSGAARRKSSTKNFASVRAFLCLKNISSKCVCDHALVDAVWKRKIDAIKSLWFQQPRPGRYSKRWMEPLYGFMGEMHLKILFTLFMMNTLAYHSWNEKNAEKKIISIKPNLTNDC